ncbi:MAG: hypothetical protein PHY34_00325 [Patescibacteria group bacterium]|nr:hypothetical protein [Patescibacteria group bacterium]MDD5715922.1 hypothetical protein [Patescibacteria group bacterium]
MRMKPWYVLVPVLIIAVAITVSGCGKKTSNTPKTNANKNTNTVVTEAPYTTENGTKIFSLQLVNGLLNYKTITVYAGDAMEIRLTDNGQPVDFEFKGITQSTNGVFGTRINLDDPGGTYQLTCLNTSCGSIAVTVINTSTNANTAANANTALNANAAAGSNTNAANQITKVELQRIPAGTTFTPTDMYETTTSFTVGDLFGLSVTGNFAAGTTFAHSFTDSTGADVEGQSQHSNLQQGSNGSCCFSLPPAAGSYNLRLIVNGTEAESVPITMSAQ